MIKNLAKEVLEALFPENFTCELCGKEVFCGEKLCADCLKRVTFNDKKSCSVCGRMTQTDGVCLECKKYAPAYDKAVSALVYEDGGMQLILKFKNGNAHLKEYFADLLKEKCAALGADIVCFVPMTTKAVRARGYNQAELIAKALASRLNIPLPGDALKKTRETDEQKTLTSAERRANVKGCFFADKSIVEGKKVLLVDDVMTTGATIEEACRQFKKKGASAVFAATVASVKFKGEI